MLHMLPANPRVERTGGQPRRHKQLPVAAGRSRANRSAATRGVTAIGIIIVTRYEHNGPIY
jgi:hypothetical protein